MTVRIINADVMAGLALLADSSVHACVTSPPYWNLRDYGFDGQVGLEPTIEEHVAKMVDVFREVRRVLRPDGVLMLNYGDMWANDDSWGGSTSGKHIAADGTKASIPRHKRKSGLKPKNLVMMPHRIALALQADGWWVRDDIVWHKPNPMPSSVKDRCTPSKEYVFQCTKSARYFWDAAAISEPAIYGEPNAPDKIKSPTGQGFTRRASVNNPAAVPPGAPQHRGLGRKNERSSGPIVEASARTRVGFNDWWDAAEVEGTPATRNRRNVWTVATEPYPNSHFATMPTELARLCILAACPIGGTVLDPFGGSGTTGLVADRLQRSAILIEASPTYVSEHIRPRIESDQPPLFAEPVL